MKQQIRRGVFETNSSSTHSITIIEENHFIPYYKEYIKEVVDYFYKKN